MAAALDLSVGSQAAVYVLHHVLSLQSTVLLVVLPQAAGVEMEDFVKVLHSFDSGAGAGPSGLRPQFLLELVGEEGDEPVARAIYEVD